MLCGLSSTGGSLFQALENRIKDEFLKAFPGWLSKFLFLSLAWKAIRLPAPSLPCTEGEVGQSDGSLLRVKQADFQGFQSQLDPGMQLSLVHVQAEARLCG